jgi:5-methylcytosine-specific restriction protein A
VEILSPTDPAGLVRAIRADAEHIGRLSAATIERFACDAGITRVLTTGRCEPLDVGRATRVISNALWKALVVRDRGCVEPGCDRPPGWCEVHHRKPWSRGGATNLENCELRCWQHHRDEHEGRGRAP